jgi:crotonobetainyl-CoA:carnitine CoA-transferase CaiB-like acyl-CoA transferase
MSKTVEASAAKTGPLAGVRVIDHTSILFGPYATQILGDLGADVVKVEAAGRESRNAGDAWRWLAPTQSRVDGLGPLFMMANRNKRSVELDLRSPEGASAMRDLLRTGDVFVSNARAPALERLGLSYEAVRQINPDIIYVHGVGYGSDGPYAERPAFDDVIQAASGVSGLLARGERADPGYFPSVLADKIAGLFLAQAVSAALYCRLAQGVAQFVEVPMFECLASFNMLEHMFGEVWQPPTGALGYPRMFAPERRPMRTADGFIAVLLYDRPQWRRFLQLLGLPEATLSNAHYFTKQGPNLAVLLPILEEALQSATADEWFVRMVAADLPVSKVNELEDVLADPHLKAVNLFETFHHPQGGDYTSIRHPVRYSVTPANVHRNPPRLGEHTAEVLAELEAGGKARS